MDVNKFYINQKKVTKVKTIKLISSYGIALVAALADVDDDLRDETDNRFIGKGLAGCP